MLPTIHHPSSRRLRRPFRRLAAIAAGSLLAAASLQPVYAQDDPLPDGGSRWGLGLGVASQTQPYRGVGSKTTALPLVFYENRWVSLQGTSIGMKLPSAGPVRLLLKAQYFGDGYEASDSPYLTGMEERKDGFWAGVAAQWRSPMADLSAEVLADASGNSKGRKVKLGAERGFRAGAFEFRPRLQATWLDDKTVGYYYGVNAAEANPNRAAYAGKSTTNLELGLRTSYALAPQQTLMLDVSYTTLGSAIKDSPLVERKHQTGLRLGYVYRF